MKKQANKQKENSRSSFSFSRKISVRDKSYFYHLFSVMLDSGIPIIECLKILTNKTENPTFAQIIDTLRVNMEGGVKLSESMMQYTDVFSDSEIGVVRSGESIGNLENLLSRLSDQMEQAYSLQQKIKSVLTYPAIVVASVVISGLIVLFFVVPSLVTFFEDSDVALPAITAAFISIASFLIAWWWLIFSIIAALAFLVGYYISTKKGKMAFDYFLLKLPVVGELNRKYQIAKISRLLSILSSAGIPINQALSMIAQATDNSIYRAQLAAVTKDVEAGEKISVNLAEAPFLFPETMISMISVGERTASIDKTSEKLSNHYDREVRHSIQTLTTVLEPTIIILVAVVVGILAFAVLGPIFSLSELI